MKIEEIMHREVVSLKPNDSIQEAARLIWKNCASSLTVVENGRLVGEVTRGDLIQAVARESSRPEEARTDAELVAEMKTRLERETWASRHTISLDVRDGVIALTGLVESAEERAALRTMARAVAGCKGVENHLLVNSQLRAYQACT